MVCKFLTGVPIDKVKELDQNVRDRVGAALLSLTLRELFEFRFMQASIAMINFSHSSREKIISFCYLCTI